MKEIERASGIPYDALSTENCEKKIQILFSQELRIREEDQESHGAMREILEDMLPVCMEFGAQLRKPWTKTDMHWRPE